MSYYESSSSSESSDSNFEVERVRKSKSLRNTNFEKNYPKNILISIIASLDITGSQTVYEEQGISEQLIQKRNSASLLDIHKILTHPILKSINKPSYEILASNILLQNSKISKKAFHLEILRDVFSFDPNVLFTEFKLEMKKKAKKNCSKDASDIPIFQFQSSTIYLLTLFCKVVENNPNQSEYTLENRESTQQENNSFSNREDLPKNNKKSNRQLLKPLIHLLCSKLGRQRWNKQKFQSVYDLMRNKILETEEKLSEKLNLKKGVPYLRLFCNQVISKCFNFIQQKQKITFSLLEKWIKIFEKLSLDNIARYIYSVNQPIEDLYEEQKQNLSTKKCSKKPKLIKGFSPIVLTAPS